MSTDGQRVGATAQVEQGEVDAIGESKKSPVEMMPNRVVEFDSKPKEKVVEIMRYDSIAVKNLPMTPGLPRRIRLLPDPKAPLPQGELRPNLYCSNVVRTSRYTAWNFIPLNLFGQLQQPANFYFFMIGILQIIRPISTSDGIPSYYTPLAFILFVSATRAAIEDYRRHVADRKEALRQVLAYRESKEFQVTAAGDLIVGEIIKVLNNQPVPADAVMLASSNKRGHCFVETASIDGETSLKVKTAVNVTHPEFAESTAISRVMGLIDVEAPNSDFDVFRGRLYLSEENGVAELQGSNLLLRGTIIKNTDFIIAAIVYTGADTRIRRNVSQGRLQRLPKTAVMSLVDRMFILLFGIQMLLCFIAGIYSGVWFAVKGDEYWYLDIGEASGVTEAVVRFFTWFIIVSQMVPISYLVSSEVVKTAQALFMNEDLSIYDRETGQRSQVQSSILNEELGQIEYVFSDKTGTLTQNRMEFRTCMVGLQLYGSSETEISKRVETRRREAKLLKDGQPFLMPRRCGWTSLVKDLSNRDASEGGGSMLFDGKDSILKAMWASNSNQENASRVRAFVTQLAISNTISPVYTGAKEELVFQSASPDELALCQAAQRLGFVLVGRNPTKLSITNLLESNSKATFEEYLHVASLDFNSKRKRVTIIYEFKGQIMVMCKGADSSILPLLHRCEESKELSQQLVDMSERGLRTLVLAEAVKERSWWDQWAPEWEKVSHLPEEDEEANHSKGGCSENCRICKGMENIERDAALSYLGTTAIEDKLQDLVPECIEDFLAAKIKVWMLTGDKRETAKNIGLACNLIDPDMQSFDADQNRLLEVTGGWAELSGDSQKMRRLFDLMDDSDSGTITLVAVRRMAERCQMPIKTASVDTAFASCADNIFFDDFTRFIEGANIDRLTSVESEVEFGLKIAESCGRPVSLVIEGAALAEMYPPGTEPPKRKIDLHISLSKKDRERRKLAEKLREAENNAAAEKKAGIDLERLARVRDRFFTLASMCKSVICCRMTPHQKAKIVEEIKIRKNAITLAIGDGANDEQMIYEANVGVGISGLEGTAASRASDYAIGQFRFLHTLLFVHGVWNYTRMTKLVHFVFYKASLVPVVMFVFGAHSVFSGHQYFDDAVYTFYNIIFTAAPILVIAVFDQVLPRKVLEDNPKVYFHLRRGALLNPWTFCAWMGASTVDAIVVYVISVLIFGETSIGNMNGTTYGISFISTTIFTALCLMITLRSLILMSTITLIHHFFVWLSFFGYFLFVYIINLIPNLTLTGVFTEMLSSGTMWLTLLLTILLPILLFLLVESVRSLYYPNYIDVMREHFVYLGLGSDSEKVESVHIANMDKDDNVKIKIEPPSMQPVDNASNHVQNQVEHLSKLETRDEGTEQASSVSNTGKGVKQATKSNLQKPRAYTLGRRTVSGDHLQMMLQVFGKTPSTLDAVGKSFLKSDVDLPNARRRPNREAVPAHFPRTDEEHKGNDSGGERSPSTDRRRSVP